MSEGVVLEILDWEEGQYSLSCRFKNVEDGVVWVFTGVYGPFTKEERECLWEEIGAIRGIWEEPWCLGDQFSGVLQRRLPRPIFDHFPLLLEGGGLRRGPSPFRIKIDGVWLLEEQEVREGVANAYQQMLSEDSRWKADIGRL
ncbi:hypothetical protein CK203_007019 [Vitis vinifera]|uniref:Uncharacterized protein n=1 Tax=Vitis vinifera TaxID=29760 RepID=A0A438KCH0_VITVI|nr:hypothetical protein CK203_007019 [Vitis vinifera]